MMVVLWGVQRAFCAPFVVYNVEVGKYGGECDQRTGVIQALQKSFPDVEVHAVLLAEETPSAQENEDLLKRIRATEKTGKRSVVLSGHHYGAQVSEFLDAKLSPETRKHVTVFLTGHQSWDSWERVRDKADGFALPEHVATMDPGLQKRLSFSRAKLIQVTGVPHSFSPAQIQEAYKKSPITYKEPCILVILGGDVQDTKANWTPYSPTEAENLVSLIVQEQKKFKAHVVVTDGPRTGKIDPTTGQEATTTHHRLNLVTEAFIKALKQKNISYSLEHFLFGPDSTFPRLLGLVNAAGTVVIVPGESTSMISQAADSLSPGRVIVYTHGAMLPVHEAHIHSEEEAGRVRVASFDGETNAWNVSSSSTQKGLPENPSETIANYLLGLF